MGAFLLADRGEVNGPLFDKIGGRRFWARVSERSEAEAEDAKHALACLAQSLPVRQLPIALSATSIGACPLCAKADIAHGTLLMSAHAGSHFGIQFLKRPDKVITCTFCCLTMNRHLQVGSTILIYNLPFHSRGISRIARWRKRPQCLGGGIFRNRPSVFGCEFDTSLGMQRRQRSFRAGITDG